MTVVITEKKISFSTYAAISCNIILSSLNSGQYLFFRNVELFQVFSMSLHVPGMHQKIGHLHNKAY